MRPLTWALKEVNPMGLHRQAGRQTYFKFKITPHKQKFIAKLFLAERWTP
jgi:hypothetical protein